MKPLFSLLATTAVTIVFPDIVSGQESLPNILWIVAEDLSPTLGCYEDTVATTPQLDTLAGKSLLYQNAWANVPVCSAARTTLITGMYAHTLGAHNHRAEVPVQAPAFVRFYTELLQEAGYYTSNASIETLRESDGSATIRRLNGKLDYNVTGPDLGWDDLTGNAHWRNRPAGKPFFSVFNIGDTHESRLRQSPPDVFAVHDPNQIIVPDVHPDNSDTRSDWARHYDWIYAMDAIAGEILSELEADGLLEETIIFFYGDHGSCMPGFKRFVGNRGQEVPLIIHIPDQFAALRPDDYIAGGSTERLVGFVDFAPTLLSLVGAEVPEWMHGQPFAGEQIRPPRDYQFGFIGRIDERTWSSRVVTDGRYVLIRNYRPDLPEGFYSQYVVGIPNNRNTEMAYTWLDRFLNGPIGEAAAAYWIAQGPIALYDLQDDPFETRNLAGDPAHVEIRDQLLDALNGWEAERPDGGLIPEGYLYEVSQSQDKDHWSVLQDPVLYPFGEILEIARVASAQEPDDLPILVDGLSHEHPLIRLWSVRGLMMLGRHSVRNNEDKLRELLVDPNYYVQVAAHQCLATHGQLSEREALVDWLFTQSSLPAYGGQNLVNNNVTDHFSERRVLFAMEALDQVPFLEQHRRAQTNQLQNQTWLTQGYRRHLYYWFYPVFSNPLAEWRYLHGLNRSGADDFNNPSGDGIPNLLRFTFNTAPEEGDLEKPLSAFTTTDGNRGGPMIGRIDGDGVYISYVRPKTPTQWPYDTVFQEFSGDTWRNLPIPDKSETLDGVYERVRYEFGVEDLKYSSTFWRVFAGRKLP